MAKRLILITGLPGSGKSVVTEAARDLGLPVVSMGDVVRKEVKKRNLPEDPRSFEQIMKGLRAKYGPTVVARRTARKMVKVSSNVVCIDGLRSLDEVEYFRNRLKDIRVVAIVSPFRLRYHRLLKRGRPGDPESDEEMRRRDLAELSVGMGEVIVSADHYLINDDEPLDAFKEDAKRLLKKLVQRVK